MKTFLCLMVLFSFAFGKGTTVKGYFKKNGAYVQPYKRSEANGKKYDNYSYKGNINPYNGKKGYKK